MVCIGENTTSGRWRFSRSAVNGSRHEVGAWIGSTAAPGGRKAR